MKAWRVMIMALAMLLLNGCLVTFTEPLPETQAAPKGLLGTWSSKDAWGEAQNLIIRSDGKNRYTAVSYPKAKPKEREAHPFTMTRHGIRWYASAQVPASKGGNYVLAGFELTDKNELVIYELDLEQIKQAIAQSNLSGDVVETGDGSTVVVNSPAAGVFAYLDDPANSDVFVEVARYQRVTQ